jgi:hypothetical protein
VYLHYIWRVPSEAFPVQSSNPEYKAGGSSRVWNLNRRIKYSLLLGLVLGKLLSF